jgi:hypothetical protein
VSTFSLHCEKCRRDLDATADTAMQLVALFKPSRFGSPGPRMVTIPSFPVAGSSESEAA